MKKLAWVAGSKSVGYRVCLEYLDVRIADFRALHGIRFAKYRAAQDIANAINASIKAKGAAK